jgi:hypothetical protein
MWTFLSNKQETNERSNELKSFSAPAGVLFQNITSYKDHAGNYIKIIETSMDIVPVLGLTAPNGWNWVEDSHNIVVGADPQIETVFKILLSDGNYLYRVLTESIDRSSGLIKAADESIHYSGVLSSETPTRWYDIAPADGKVLPISAPRAYYPSILYSSTPVFFDGTKLRKYVAYYGAGTSPVFSSAAFSDDGKTWDNEQQLSGVVGDAYHAASILIGTTIHYFYWDTTTTIYSPSATRHATFNAAVSCTAAVTDAACTGNYITGISGDLRNGTYGFNQVFYNAAPTNNPANPYSYTWCAIHSGTDGSNEGILFATSTDGLNFTKWNNLVEVIPRGLSTSFWDYMIGTMFVFTDSTGFYHAYYSGGLGTSNGEDTNFGGGIGYATSVDGITWVKYEKNPIIRKTEALKIWKRCYTPCVIKDSHGVYTMYYSGKSSAGVYTVLSAKIAGFI